MLAVTVRISDHAQETQFYGDVKNAVPEFNFIKGSAPYEVWRDTKCHHERGLPKITLIKVEGSIRNGTNQTPVSARFRWLGRLMPGDEITVGKTVSTGADKTGPFRILRAETKESRVVIDLKLYILPCELSEG